MEELILLASPIRHVWRRLRFVALQRVISVGLRWIEWESFKSLIPANYAFTYLLIRYALEYLLRFRWSALEDLRGELSRLLQIRQHRLIRGLIEEEWQKAWFSIPLLLALGISGLGFLWKEELPFLPWCLTALLFLRFASDWILRTLQSFVYAESRVARPFWSISGFDVLHGVLLLLLSRRFGMPGVLAASGIETGLRIGITFFLTLKTYGRSSLPPLPRPRLRFPRYRVHLRPILTGLTLPMIELSFLFSTVVYYNAFRDFDPDQEYQKLLYLISPLLNSATGFYFLYYVDFLKHSRRVFSKIYSMILKDAFRALFAYAILCFGIAMIADWKASFSPVGAVPLLFLPSFIFSWGSFFLASVAAFIRGSRIGLMLLALPVGVGVTASWDFESLAALSVGVPLLGAGFALLLLRKNPGSDEVEWTALEHLRDWIENGSGGSGTLQGVLLESHSLGFAFHDAIERLIRHLPRGSRISLAGSHSLYWWIPGSARLGPLQLLEIFGPYWRKEITTLPAPQSRVHLRDAESWKIGESIAPMTLGLIRNHGPSGLSRAWSQVKKRANGRPVHHSRLKLRFHPEFSGGVFTGGIFTSKSRPKDDSTLD